MFGTDRSPERRFPRFVLAAFVPFVALVVACSAAPPAPRPAPPAPQPPQPPAYVPLAIALPPAPDVPSVQRICAQKPTTAAASTTNGTTSSPPRKTKTYDFSAHTITLAYGPTPESQTHEGWLRDREAVRGAIIARRGDLESCVALARSSKQSRTRIAQYRGVFQQMAEATVKLTIDPFGRASDIVVEDAPPELACIKDALAGIAVTRPTPRVTRVTARLVLLKLDKVTPRKQVSYTQPERWGCMLARDPLPVDDLALDEIEIDFASQRRPSRRCPFRYTDKATIRSAINDNMGSLRACYVDAATRTKGLRGTVDTKFVVEEWGTLGQIAVTGAGDAQLHACMTTALELVIIAARPDVPITVNLPFELDPDPVPTSPAETFAERATKAHDVESAAAAWLARASTADNVTEECRARVGLIEAYGSGRGASDPRSLDAIAAFNTFLDARGRPADCIEQAASSLAAIGMWPITNVHDSHLHLRRGSGLTEAVRRTRRILQLVPELRPQLLPFVIDAEIKRLRFTSALADALTFLGLPGTEPKDRERVAESYARAVALRDGTFPYDDCESNAPY